MDQLRNAVSLRGYAQNNPIVEYQSESFNMFNDMIGAIEFEVTRLMMKAQEFMTILNGNAQYRITYNGS